MRGNICETSMRCWFSTSTAIHCFRPMVTLHFERVPRRKRAKGLVPRIRRCSKRFKAAIALGDAPAASKASADAWTAMTNLFEILRGEQDAGYLTGDMMAVETGLIADGLSTGDQQRMMTTKRIDRSLSVGLSLREACNKLAHYSDATYRVDGRNAHYLVLAGVYRNKNWVAEILVARLCKNAATAIRSING